MRSITNMISNIKRLGALLLGCLLVSSPVFAQEKETGLTIGAISVSTKFLNPLLPEEREFMSLTSLVYESLVSINDDYLPEPCVAEKWEHSSDGRTWHFTLRQNITFHNGIPLTAHDVVATIHAIMDFSADTTRANKGAYSSLKYFIGNKEAVKANDNLTVVIKTNRPNFGFLYALTFPILPKDYVTAENPPGTGPYKAEQFVPKDFLLLSAYSGWWKGQAKTKEIMCIFHTTNRDLLSSYEYNRVDAIMTRSLTAAQYRSGVSSMNISYRTKQLDLLLMNNQARELSDVKVRTAIRHAINMHDILTGSYMDMALGTETPMIPGTWTYFEDPGSFEFNPDKARQLLEEAGWTDTDGDGIRERFVDGKKQTLRLRFVVYEEQDNSVRASAANKICDMLRQVGIQCNEKFSPELLNFSAVREKLQSGSFDLSIASFNMDTVPDPGFLLMSRNTGNFGRYNNKKMDELFKELRGSLSKEKYQSTLLQIQSTFINDCPFICIGYRKGAVLTRKMFTDARDIREPEVLRGTAEGAEHRQ